jgi:regulator of replication initiation timing
MSRPKVLGEGSSILKWSRAVIHRLSQKIKEGTKFFIDHGDNTNSHDGRRSVGEVLTSFVKDIGGKLSNIIIGHFPDKESVNNADVCSMEADIETNGEYVDDVDNVTGVALGNSNVDSPAFPGAFRLNAIQCFDNDNTDDNKNNPGRGDQPMKITFHDIKNAIKEMNIFPWQLYTVEDLKNDKNFGKIFEENSTLKAETERLTKEFDSLSEKNKEAIRATEVQKAKDTIEKMMSDGFTDKQKTFIKGRFKPEMLEKLDENSLKDHLENEKKVFSETAKLFGSGETVNTDKSSDGDSTDDASKSMEEKALEAMGV